MFTVQISTKYLPLVAKLITMADDNDADSINLTTDDTPVAPTLTYNFQRFGLAGVNNNNRILTIKAVREALRCGLKDAKDIVDRHYFNDSGNRYQFTASEAEVLNACFKRDNIIGAYTWELCFT